MSAPRLAPVANGETAPSGATLIAPLVRPGYGLESLLGDVKSDTNERPPEIACELGVMGTVNDHYTKEGSALPPIDAGISLGP